MKLASDRERYEHKVLYIEFGSTTSNKEDAQSLTEELAKWKNWQIANVVTGSSGRFWIFLTREL